MTTSGYYRFEVKRGATYTLRVSANNYKMKTATVTAGAFVNVFDFALEAQ